jgi:excisionase family DNA binding protein
MSKYTEKRTQMDTQDQWMTPDQVCDWLQVRKDWIYDACQKKKIPHARIGRQLRFNRAELTEWLEALRQC